MLELSLEKESKDIIFKVETDETIYTGVLKLANSTLRNNFNTIRNYFVNCYNYSEKTKKVLQDFFIKISEGYFNLHSVSLKSKLNELHKVSDAMYEYLISIYPIQSWYKSANLKKEELSMENIHNIVRYISAIIVGSIISDSYRNLSIKMYDRHQKTIELLRTMIVSKTLTLNSFSQFYFYSSILLKDETDVVTKTITFINLMYSILITKDLHTVENFIGFLITTFKKSLDNYDKSYISTNSYITNVDNTSVTDDIISYLNTEITFENFIRVQSNLLYSKNISETNKEQFNIFKFYTEYYPTYITYLTNNILENLGFTRSTLEKYQVLTQYFLHTSLKGLNLSEEYGIEYPLKCLRYITKSDTTKMTTSDRTKIVTGIMNELQKHLDSLFSYTHHIEKLGILTTEKRIVIEDMFNGKPIPPTENVVRNLVEFMKFYILFMEKRELRELVSSGIYKNKLYPSRKDLHSLIYNAKQLV